MWKKMLITSLLVGLALSACAPAVTPTTEPTVAPVGSRTLTVMTHDSFAVSEEVVAAFEKENNTKVQFLQSGDAGTALNKAILSKNNPLADVFYGVDNTFLSRALSQDIFDPYASPLLAEIPDEFKLDGQNRALPVDYGDVCLNYDIDFLAKKGIQPPQNLEDLLKPEYKGLMAVENPATSSPGLAFLLATIGHFGEDKYLDYWKELVKNDVQVVNDWNAVYYTEFTRAGGSRPIVVSYGSSPAVEVIYADPPITEAPTGVVTGDGSCFRQVEFVGILKGTKNLDLAQKWIDFMLSASFQEDMPLKMFVFPVNKNAKLAEAFTRYMAAPAKLSEVSPESIDANREKWLQAWTEVVLR